MAGKSGKIYYSMGEVAEMLDVSQPTLRFWEGKFDIIAPHKNKKGNRMFSPEDVRNLKTIYHLVKERGMTLAGADKHLKANRKAIEHDMEIAERLASIRALLVEVRHELGGDGTIVDDGVEETVDEMVEPIEPEVEHAIEQAHEEEVIDALMDDVVEELVAAEVLPPTDPEPVFTPEPESAPDDLEPQSPKYVEQTLF